MARNKIAGAAEYIIPLAVASGLVYVIWALANGKLNLLGTPASTSNNNSVTDANKAATAATAAAAAASGVKPTISNDLAASIAAQVWTNGTNSDSFDPGVTNSLITQVNNIADLNLVIQYFGTKQIANSSSLFSMCTTFGYNCVAVDFPTFVRVAYNNYDNGAAYLQSLNEYMSDAGINFTF